MKIEHKENRMADELEQCVIENTRRLYHRYIEVMGYGQSKIVNFKTYSHNVVLKGILIEHEELAKLEKELGIT